MEKSHNRYFERHFSDEPCLPPDEAMVDVTQSNAIYDKHRFVSHAFVSEKLPDGTLRKRLVSDVELCASNFPTVRAVVTKEYQEKLKNKLVNMHSNSSNTNMSDDDLIASMIPQGLERDEIVDAIGSISPRLQRFLEKQQTSTDDAADVVSPPPCESTNVK